MNPKSKPPNRTENHGRELTRLCRTLTLLLLPSHSHLSNTLAACMPDLTCCPGVTPRNHEAACGGPHVHRRHSSVTTRGQRAQGLTLPLWGWFHCGDVGSNADVRAIANKGTKGVRLETPALPVLRSLWGRGGGEPAAW